MWYIPLKESINSTGYPNASPMAPPINEPLLLSCNVFISSSFLFSPHLCLFAHVVQFTITLIDIPELHDHFSFCVNESIDLYVLIISILFIIL